MLIHQVHEYIKDERFWTGAISGVLFTSVFLMVLTINKDHKNDWWKI